VVRWWRVVLRIGNDGADPIAIAELRRIIARYGHLPDIAVQVLRWGARGPAPAWAWMVDDAHLLYPGTNVVGTAAAFDQVSDPQIARLFVALGRRFPPLTGVLAAADRNEAIPYGPPFEVHEPMQRAILRIWSLARGTD
jgi:hypothetical protein